METITPDTNNILIISYGPVPTPEFQKIEGGGMRCWGLATGLRDNGHNVTVSVFQEFQQTRKSYQGIRLHNWALNDEFKSYLNSFDAVIVSYSMGDLSMFVADNLSHYITLVLDCYVPIFIEISARDSEDKASELKNYLYEVRRFNHVLKRGDFFLCANEPQKHMYAGILGSLGVINPYSYRQHRILLVPFGVDDKVRLSESLKNPYQISGKDDFVLLWFGGLYPWFNFKPLISAISHLSANPKFKFYLVGGKNPYNNHPDFVKQYNYVLHAFEALKLLNKSVFLIDWVDFDDRIRWYKFADLVVSINSPGEENIYSWRTRVMDYVGGEISMMSNGGDPLSDELIARDAAVKIGLSSQEIEDRVKYLISHPDALRKVHKNLLDIKKQYYWSNLTKPLSDQIRSDNALPYVGELSFMEEHKIETQKENRNSRKIPLFIYKARPYVLKAKQKGIKRSAKFALKTLRAQAKSSLSISRHRTTEKRAFFLSHPIDHTGAPLVLLDIIKDFSQVFTNRNINVVAPAIERDILNSLLSEKYKIHKMADGIGGRFIQYGLQIKPDDFVLINTVAVYQNYKDFIYWILESSRLKRAYWFVHEDSPKMRFGNRREISRIKHLIGSGKLQLLVPSIQTASEYNDFFETTSVMPVALRVKIPEKLRQKHRVSDFSNIKFFMSGIPLDGRKGQLLFLSALQLFEAKYKKAHPEQYRPYSLDLVAIGKDYISEQIVVIGKAILGENLHIHPIVSREKALEITSTCNVSVCCSLNETFALYIAEGMLMGHPIIRNKTSGWQEQIKDGENGFMFNTLSLEELADCIRKVLSKNTSNQELARMGEASMKMASIFSQANYYKEIMKTETKD